MVGAVATFFPGSPFWNMKSIGELASIDFGAAFTIIHK
jgi:hypothetical protein